MRHGNHRNRRRRKGWTVKHGARVLFIDTVEERTFQTALAISHTLFDEGVRTQVVLIRQRQLGAPSGLPQSSQDRGRQVRQVLGDQAGAVGRAGLGVDPGAGARGLEALHALGDQAGDESGQHVAATRPSPARARRSG